MYGFEPRFHRSNTVVGMHHLTEKNSCHDSNSFHLQGGNLLLSDELSQNTILYIYYNQVKVHVSTPFLVFLSRIRNKMYHVTKVAVHSLNEVYMAFLI
jgi:hypothetical protein